MFYSHLYMICFIVAILLAIKLYQARRTSVGLMLAYVSLLTSFWLLMEGLSFYSFSDSTIIFFQKVKYGPIISIGPLLCITIFGMIRNYTKKNSRILALLFVVPLLTCLSLLTNTFPYSFIDNESVERTENLLLFLYDRNIGFYIHVGYSYLLMVSSSIILFYRAFKSPRIYRIQSLFLFWGSTTTFVLNLLFVFQLLGNNNIDTTPISILGTIFVYYWGIYVVPRSLVIPQARNLIIENMSDMILTVDSNNRILDMNLAAKEVALEYSSLFKTSINEIDYLGMDFNLLIDSLTFTSTERIHAYLKDGAHNSFKIKSDKGDQHFELRIVELKDTDHKSIGSLYKLRDVSAMQKNIDNLLLLNSHLQMSDTIINESREGIIITDINDKIIRVNRSIEAMTGYLYYELLGEKPSILQSGKHDEQFFRALRASVHEKGYWEGEIWNLKKNGELYPSWLTAQVLKDEEGKVSHYLYISTDISEMKKAEEDLEKMAYYDTLTDLPNRAMFSKNLKGALKNAKDRESELAILYIDLDRFKIINDTYGHSTGDLLLIQVVTRIEDVINDNEQLYRLGGDEFTIIIESHELENYVKEFSENIISKFSKTFVINGNHINVYPSIGVAFAPKDDQTAEGLMRKVDLAMYAAKEKGGNRMCIYADTLEIAIKELHFTEMKLRKAIKNNEFELYLQPQVSRLEGKDRIIGAEALIRWPQADGSMIPPFKFIGISERNGMIQDIGQIVLQQIFDIYHKLAKLDIKINLSFNASTKQFNTDDFYLQLKHLKTIKKNADIDLTMEVTESLLFEDENRAIKMLHDIKNLGVNIALDDFGTGYSSMSYLNKLPIDYLKIDKSFIDEMDDHSTNLAHMIVLMAKTLKLKVVAEGVEEKEQLDSMYRVDCDIIQGYYYSKPLSISDFIDYYKAFK